MLHLSLIRWVLASNHLQAVNWAIQNGAVLSRARLQTFKHNDMEDLERVLQEQARHDQKRKYVPALPVPSWPWSRRRDVLPAGLQLTSCQGHARP